MIACTRNRGVVALDTRIALRPAELQRDHELAAADGIVHATARAQGADLLTCDAHFNALPGVRFHGKATS